MSTAQCESYVCVSALGANGEEIRAEVQEHKTAFGRFLRKGAEDGLRDLEVKALNTSVGADGGFAVPKEIDANISALAVNVSPIRAIANVMTMSTSDYRKLVNKRGTASGWVGESDARPETGTPALAEVTPYWGELYANPMVTQRMLDDSFFDAEAWLAGELATEFARAEGSAFVTGDGVNKPKGFLAYATVATADGARAFGTLQHLATGAAGDFAASNKADVLLSTVYALKAAHRANATWVTNKAILGEIRGFKDQYGQYLWQPGLAAGQPSTLLGYAVVEAEDMPAKAANSMSIAFGDFKAGYCICDRIGTRVIRDQYSNKPYVSFYTTKRTGAMVIDGEAIKIVKFA